MKIRLGIDVACRAAHQASCADEHGQMLFVGHRFHTDPDELEDLWNRLPPDRDEVMVVMEPTRNAWVALAAWFSLRGATVLMIPPEQSADLRAYYSKHAKTDRLDCKVLARLLLLHLDGLHREDTLGPGEVLKRAVRVRSGLVHRQSTSMARLDALLEILGPAWVAAIGSDMCGTALRFLARYGDPRKVKRPGPARLAHFFHRSSRGAWHHERAAVVIEAADATLRLWGPDGMDFDALAADIAAEARLALAISEEINRLDKRIADGYERVDPDGIVQSVPGVGRVRPPQIAGRLGDVHRFANLAAVRCFAGLVPHQDSPGMAARAGGPTMARGRLPARGAVPGGRPRPQDRPDPRRPLPPLITESGKHHNSAPCTIAAVLLTRIAASWAPASATSSATPTARLSLSRKAARSSLTGTPSPRGPSDPTPHEPLPLPVSSVALLSVLPIARVDNSGILLDDADHCGFGGAQSDARRKRTSGTEIHLNLAAHS